MESEVVKKVHNYIILKSFLLGVSGNKNEGALSEVYIGFKTGNPKKLYAIKMIGLKQLTSKDRNEYILAKDLNSLNLLSVYESIQTKKHYYYITEFCPQGSLETYLQNERNILSEPVAISLMASILKGYHTMNKSKLLHRDLKPANILLKDFLVKICDYGFARFVNNPNIIDLMTYTGTPLFMAPELFDEKIECNQVEYNHKCDIWSLGVLFYKILIGTYPWIGANLPDLKIKMREIPLEFPDYIEISDKTKSIIEKMLDKNKETRISIEKLVQNEIFNQDSLENCLLNEKYPGFLDFLSYEEEDSKKIYQKIDDEVFEAKDFYLKIKSCFKSLIYLSHLRNRIELISDIILTIKNKNSTKKEKVNDEEIIYLLYFSLKNEIKRIKFILQTFKEKNKNEFVSESFYKMKYFNKIKEKLSSLYKNKKEETKNFISDYLKKNDDIAKEYENKMEKYMKKLNNKDKFDLILLKKLYFCCEPNKLETYFSYEEDLNFAKDFLSLKNIVYQHEDKFDYFCSKFFKPINKL